MGLLRDWTFIEEAVRIPALREVVREALIKAVFTRDDRVLPREIIADLTRAPAATVKVKDDAEIRKLVQVFNGSESSVNLGLAAEDCAAIFDVVAGMSGARGTRKRTEQDGGA